VKPGAYFRPVRTDGVAHRFDRNRSNIARLQPVGGRIAPAPMPAAEAAIGVGLRGMTPAAIL
jgi:hypothetical protein